MACETFLIQPGGEEDSELYSDLLSLEVELDNNLASMFRLRLALSLRPDGSWSYLDDDRFRIWEKVVIQAGFDGSVEEIMVGYITHVKPNFEPDLTQCTVDIWGMDGSVLMDRVERLKDWPNKKDSDIAAELFGLYGFAAEVEDTEVVHDESISTIIQRETDIQFLKRLALRNGFECFVDGNTGYFRPPRPDEAPQPVLAVHFGGETNVSRFSIEVDALAPTTVAMFQVDRLSKEVLKAVADSSLQAALGKNGAGELLSAGMEPGRHHIRMNAATGTLEMDALCRGLFHEAEWFVTGEGEIMGNKYEHLLKPRGTVTIKGVAEAFSGVYYVDHVTHAFTPAGFSQTFRVKRNGLNPTGAENFAGNGGSG